MSDWFSTDDDARLVGAWSDAPIDRDELCTFLLDTARQQVIEYADDLLEPAVRVASVLDEVGYSAEQVAAVLALLEEDEPDGVPDRFVYAQLQQAINLWNAGRADGDGDVGADGYRYTPRPLDKTIRSIIRMTGVPSVA